METADAMDRAAFARDYAAALHDYVAGAGEEALVRAYELGRTAATAGVGLLDLALVHHEALLALPARGVEPPLGMATQFFAESLSPYEMTLRSYQANARLLGLGEALAQRNAEIDRSRQQLHTILDATTAVIYLKDAEGRYQFVNRRFEEVFGVRRDAVIGRVDAEVLAPASAEALSAVDARALSARAPREIEEIVPGVEGPRTWLSLKFPLLDGGGAPYGICCVATDITERKRSEEALQRAREAAEREQVLREALEARDQFLGIASHELKTPLTALELHLASFRRLSRSTPDATLGDEKVQAKWELIARLADRLAVLVNNLLDVARITSGRLELSRERLDLAEVVREVVGRMHDAIAWSRSEVVVRAPAPVVGTWDRRCVESVVANLLSNAVKFGEEKPIELAVNAAAGRAILTVRDHGMGISAEDQTRIFERFERAVSQRHFGGFGVGLWVARQALDVQGGTIRVVSRPGEGSVFTVELPLDGGAAPG